MNAIEYPLRLMPLDRDFWPGGGGGGGGGAGPLRVPDAEEGTGLDEELDEIAAAGPPDPPDASDLHEWTQVDYDLDSRTAAKLGFGFGGLSVSASQRLLIREFARSSNKLAADGRKYRFGTAVRLLVRTEGIAAEGSLSLSVVAANTQIGRTQAESSLKVVGYKGDKLAGLLPPFRTFNVDAYAEMSTRMNAVKELIGADMQNVSPQVLGVELEEEDEAEPDISAALGLLWGLSRLAKGHSCTRAKREYPDGGSLVAVNEISRAYSLVPRGSCSGKRPTKLQQAHARDLLRGLELRS